MRLAPNSILDGIKVNPSAGRMVKATDCASLGDVPRLLPEMFFTFNAVFTSPRERVPLIIIASPSLTSGVDKQASVSMLPYTASPIFSSESRNGNVIAASLMIIVSAPASETVPCSVTSESAMYFPVAVEERALSHGYIRI